MPLSIFANLSASILVLESLAELAEAAELLAESWL
jgi:hypothetical protein